eukprot:TRINITY_DN276_c0_g3_i1.p1 TRINITY_DN276_c0_g3~~TRINITY_DN276_c0_g3_i1.p1  ORF type:complete len:734 (+),score=178.58 TRINITY_DN276_c0_g3_i1:103-2304(+)
MAATGDVVFVATCKETAHGEELFVCGSDPLLGAWQPSGALRLTTTAETFPNWTSEIVSLKADTPVEFKFVISKSGASNGKWESFPKNRRVVPEKGHLISCLGAWEVNRLAVTQTAREGDANDVGPAMSSELSQKLEDRDSMRRNFSQSLLGLPPLEVESPAPEAAKEEEIVAPSAATAEVDKTESMKRKGVSLQHVMSFSALSSMAEAETKTSARQSQVRKRSYEPYNADVPVVVVTSEVSPYSKTGGLGLVAASYSYEFPQNGHRTMVVSPKYRHYEGIEYVGETMVVVDGFQEKVRYFHKWVDHGGGKGCDFVFVDHPCIERNGGLYNGDDGKEYEDNVKRFAILSMAAMEAPLILPLGGVTYGDKVMFVANDWQAGLIPVFMIYKYRRHSVYLQARVMYVVHNLGYQGRYHIIDACKFFGIEPKAYEDMAFGNCINLSKAALICADRVITVSPNYAREIQTPEGGFGLEDVVRGKAHGMRLVGILNGIDDNWNPLKDKDIAVNYDIDTFEEGKRKNKAALQKQLGLHEDPNAILLGFVGRLTWQKGVDVFAGAIPWLMEDTGNGVTGRVQVIMMGHGDRASAQHLEWAESTYRGRVCGYVGFDPKVEHLMMAGCDCFVMPSRYEPCGLPQMYSQSYGTLPIVASTGGLVDSVVDVSLGLEGATGFHIPFFMDTDKIKEALWKAMEMFFKRPDEFRQMQRNAMAKDFYWPQAMDEYEKSIDYTLYDPPATR